MATAHHSPNLHMEPPEGERGAVSSQGSQLRDRECFLPQISTNFFLASHWSIPRCGWSLNYGFLSSFLDQALAEGTDHAQVHP